MRCADCGKTFDHKLNELYEGRRVIYVCDMCKAERQWRESDGKVIMPPPGKTLGEKFEEKKQIIKGTMRHRWEDFKEYMRVWWAKIKRRFRGE